MIKIAEGNRNIIIYNAKINSNIFLLQRKFES